LNIQLCIGNWILYTVEPHHLESKLAVSLGKLEVK
jgi:hypothetical protein